MILQPVPRPTVRWVMDLGPIDTVSRLLVELPAYAFCAWLAAPVSIGLGRIVVHLLGIR